MRLVGMLTNEGSSRHVTYYVMMLCYLLYYETLALVCGHWASFVVGDGCTRAPHCVLVAKALRGATPGAATILKK